MKIKQFITLLEDLDTIAFKYKIEQIEARYDFYTGTATIYYENDLGFSFADLHEARYWLWHEFVPALEERA